VNENRLFCLHFLHYIAVLQVNIICSPPGKVSTGPVLETPRGHGSGRARGLTLGFAWSADRAHPHPPNVFLLFPSHSHYRTRTVRMWIMRVLFFLPVASTMSLGLREPSGNFLWVGIRSQPPYHLQSTSTSAYICVINNSAKF
jgi:hypothetical protein